MRLTLIIIRGIIDEPGAIKKERRMKEIYRFVDENRAKLIMPDQDILNALYAKRIKSLNELLHNYDARYYTYYKMASHGSFDMDQIINNTVILHFCGRRNLGIKNILERSILFINTMKSNKIICFNKC